MRLSNPNVDKLMINATYGRPIRARHPWVENY